MSEPEPDDGYYPAGVDVPGTPGPFPVGIAAFGLAIAAIGFGLTATFPGSEDWLPVIFGVPLFYCTALLGCFICSALAVRQGSWGWALTSTVLAIVTLTPIFPLAIVLLLSLVN